VKTHADRWEFLHSGFHHRGSHTTSKGILSPSQRNAVITSVKHSPMTARGSVMSNLDSLSPGKRVPFDGRSARAVGRLVDATRRELLSKQMPDGIDLDGSEGAMIQFAESISLSRLIARHNDIHDRFHLDEHQPLCLGYQFKKNVRHLCLSSASMLTNGARGINSKWQIFLHSDGAYNWCKKDIGLLAFGLNSMGNHYNPLSISIVNSESIASITTSWRNTVKGLYSLFKEVQICNDDECSFCSMLREQIEGEEGRPWLQHLESEEGRAGRFPVDKPASDNSKAWFGAAHDLFGVDILVALPSVASAPNFGFGPNCRRLRRASFAYIPMISIGRLRVRLPPKRQRWTGHLCRHLLEMKPPHKLLCRLC
jgi:hypothetical protein